MDTWAVPGYTESRELGSGGGGRVVLAVHEATGVPVAIKYLRERLRSDDSFVREFRSEARLLGGLDSPYVVGLYEYVESPAGAAIVMEVVDGVSLRMLLRQEGATGPEAALAVLKGSLLGLAAAHRIGVVHRDYKPGNVLVAQDGTSKLVDFGIAVRSGDAAGVAGTPAYMSPEQWNGAPASPASDVYAATAVFYECLTGRQPYRGGNFAELALRHLDAPVPDADVPEPVRPLVRRGLAKTAGERPGDAAAFVAELEHLAGAAYGPRWEERGQRRLAALAALLPLLLLPVDGGPAGGAADVATTDFADDGGAGSAIAGGDGGRYGDGGFPGGGSGGAHGEVPGGGAWYGDAPGAGGGGGSGGGGGPDSGSDGGGTAGGGGGHGGWSDIWRPGLKGLLAAGAALAVAAGVVLGADAGPGSTTEHIGARIHATTTASGPAAASPAPSPGATGDPSAETSAWPSARPSSGAPGTPRPWVSEWPSASASASASHHVRPAPSASASASAWAPPPSSAPPSGRPSAAWPSSAPPPSLPPATRVRQISVTGPAGRAGTARAAVEVVTEGAGPVTVVVQWFSRAQEGAPEVAEAAETHRLEGGTAYSIATSRIFGHGVCVRGLRVSADPAAPGGTVTRELDSCGLR
jgi:eukaryotic-like serine/threonine-protein kinase